MTTIWYGQPGHFCDAHCCQWHLHTHVQDRTGRWYCVSSVGEYVKDGKIESLRGLGKDQPPVLYETIVFESTEGTNFSLEEKYVHLWYDRDAAQEGHARILREVREWCGIIPEKE